MELRAGPEHAGERLDAFLAGPLGSRSRAQRLIDAGSVTVDGRRVAEAPPALRRRARRRRRARDAAAASVRTASRRASASPRRTSTCWSSTSPPGVVVHPARGHTTGTLVQASSGRVAGGEDDERPGIVHRLDRDTSGLLVVARSEAVHRALKAQLQRRAIRREYLTLVDGRPPARSGTIDAPLGRDRRDRKQMSTDTDEPREAVTHFEIERALRDDDAAARAPGDGAHAPDPRAPARDRPPGRRRSGLRRCRACYGLERQFLHAARLAFEHPVTRRGGRRQLTAAGGPAGRARRSRALTVPAAARRPPSALGPAGQPDVGEHRQRDRLRDVARTGAATASSSAARRSGASSATNVIEAT